MHVHEADPKTASLGQADPRYGLQPQRARAAHTGSSEMSDSYSFFGLLTRNAYASMEASCARTKPARLCSLFSVPVFFRTRPRALVVASSNIRTPSLPSAPATGSPVTTPRSSG